MSPAAHGPFDREPRSGPTNDHMRTRPLGVRASAICRQEVALSDVFSIPLASPQVAQIPAPPHHEQVHAGSKLRWPANQPLPRQCPQRQSRVAGHQKPGTSKAGAVPGVLLGLVNGSAHRILKTQEDAPEWFLQVLTGGSGLAGLTADGCFSGVLGGRSSDDAPEVPDEMGVVVIAQV